MAEIHAGISFNLDSGLVQSALPLFQSEEVDAIEWSFDTLHGREELPAWWGELLDTYGQAGRLTGHGVFFSLFAGKWMPEQAAWLAELRELCSRFRFEHISEHFGFLTGADFHKGAPLSVPYSPATLAIGQDRLMRIADACGRPVGLENLAFAADLSAARVHGEFLERLLAPVNGFLLLDLHNLYCHLHNFGLDADALLAAYPLHRVREVHISGGSWEASDHRPAPGVRRDTHDDRVPEAVFALAQTVLPRCPNVRFAYLEHMGHTLVGAEAQEGFRADYRRLRRIVHGMQGRPSADEAAFQPPTMHLPPPLEDPGLHACQRALSDILEQGETFADVRHAMAASVLQGTDWELKAWDPAMLETAWRIARKWKDGI